MKKSTSKLQILPKRSTTRQIDNVALESLGPLVTDCFSANLQNIVLRATSDKSYFTK